VSKLRRKEYASSGTAAVEALLRADGAGDASRLGVYAGVGPRVGPDAAVGDGV
jgi:hypothetical protein